MAATLKSIAAECGVSAQTVSRILNPDYAHLYKKETQEMVRQKVQELGYRPNAAAKAMKSGSFKSILLLQSSNPSFSHMTSELLYSIQNTLSSLEYKLICSILPDDRETAEVELGKILNESFVDGILVCIARAIPKWLENLLESNNVPVFWIGSKHTHNCIHHDDFQAGYDITKRFIGLGHKNIVYADYLSPEDETAHWHFSASDRMEGYKKAMLEADLQPEIIRSKTYLLEENAVAFTEEHLLKGSHPTAVVTYGMETCRPIIYALMKNGLKVPDDVSLCTFSSQIYAENDLQVACFLPSKMEIGKIAVELVYDKIQNRRLNPEPIVFPFDYFDGDTIAPPQK